MEILPLYRLFTTKEDRLAVYKVLKYSQRPNKSYDLFTAVARRVYSSDYIDTEKVTVNQADVSTDVSKILAKNAGVDLLTMKQMIFCYLMAEAPNTVPEDAEPFMCKTVEEIDALGKRVFGAKWVAHNTSSESTYSVEYTDERLTERLDTYDKMPTISAPLIYKEMFGALKDYKGFGIYTFLALLAVGRSMADEIRDFDLKGYLNNEYRRQTNKDIEELIEQKFFAYLLLYRAYMSCRLGEVSESVEEESFVKHRAESSCGASAPIMHLALYGTLELWDAYRTALLEGRDGNGHQLVCSGSDEFRKFIIDDVWLKYLRDNWGHIVTSAPVMEKTKYDGISRLLVVADMDTFRETTALRDGRVVPSYRTLPAYMVADNMHLISDIDNLPADLDIVKDLGVICYTSALYRFLWDWGGAGGFKAGYDVSGKHRECVEAPRMLITNSCYISVLRRAGAKLYFAFRADNAEGEPLVLYVDNEEDKSFVEDCAKSVNADLEGGKNSVVLLTKPANSFTPLDHSLDTLSPWELVEETGRYYLLLLMTANSENTAIQRRYADWEPDPVYVDETNTYQKTIIGEGNGRSIYLRKDYKEDEVRDTVFARSEDGCKRGVVNFFSLFAPYGYIDTEYAESACIAFDLKNRCKVVFGGENTIKSDVNAIFFPSARVVSIKYKSNKNYSSNEQYAWLRDTPLALLVKDGYCEYVRWQELPALIPEWLEAWETVNAIPTRLLREYLSTMFRVDLREV